MKQESCGHSRLQGLCDRADLVDLQQETVAGLISHGFGDAFGVGDSEVIADHLDAGGGSKFGPCIPVILVKWILNGNHCGGTKFHVNDKELPKTCKPSSLGGAGGNKTRYLKISEPVC